MWLRPTGLKPFWSPWWQLSQFKSGAAFAVVVAEEWRRNAERRGKIFCRPKMAFLRENLVLRVPRRSSQSWAPSSECTSREPTNEECHLSCPAPSAAELDNREFPAPEMGAKGRDTRIGTVSRPALAIDVPVVSAGAAQRGIVYLRCSRELRFLL
jgi:hypothetical protein